MGYTLAELIVALSLMGTLAALVLGIVRDHQRMNAGTREVLQTKRSVREALELLVADLRVMASSDIIHFTDSSITYRAPYGSSAICHIDSARRLITLPATRAHAVNGLSGFITGPRRGDSIFVFDLVDRSTGNDDRWHARLLVADPITSVCPLRPAGLARDAGERVQGIGMALGIPLPATVTVGTPVRPFRAATYSLYRSSTGDWMLGFSSCAGGSCSIRQPVSGPYLSRSAGGLVFRYVDADGRETGDPSRVARIDVITRSRSTTTIDLPHARGRHFVDSLAISIALRNRS
jgi:hypothetical protein